MGLDVEIKERIPKFNNIEQVINGESQYGIADSVLLLYKSKGEPVVIVSPIFQHSPSIVYSLKNKNINSPYKFNGKEMLFYPNDTDGFAILGMLKELNIKPNLIRDRKKDDYLRLLNGEIDLAPGYLSNEPFYFKERNLELNIVNPTNYGFDLYGDMIFTTQEEANNHPNRVKKFKEASLKGWKYALDNKEEIIQLIKQKYNKSKSIEHLRYEANIIENLITKDLVPVGTLDEGRITYIFNLYKKFGLTSNNLDVKNFIFKDYNGLTNTDIKLTKKEIEFIRNNPIIKASNELDWAPFDFTINGEAKGYSIDLLNLLGSKVGLKFNYINGYSWSGLIELFKEKEIDILHSLAQNEERKSFGKFTKPYLRYQTHFIVRENENEVNSIEELTNKTIAVGKDWAIDTYLKENYPQLNVIRLSNIEEILNSLSSGKADVAILNKSVVSYHLKKRNISNLKISNWCREFDGNQAQMLHFLIQKNKPELVSLLNKALDSVTIEEIEILNKKWIGSSSSKNEISFKEKEFISRYPKIRFKVQKGRPPFEYEENGKAVGLAVDYIRKSALNIGLEAEFILNDDPIPISHKIINTTREPYDTQLFSVKSPQREKEFSFGIPYMTYPMMIITNKKTSYVNSLKDLNGKTIVLEEKYLTNKWIKRDYPNIKIINAKNSINALKMVNDGKVDAYVGNSAVTNFLSTHGGMDNLKIAAPSGYGNVKFNFIAPKEWPELASLLSKGYKMISPIEHSEIQQKWFSLHTVQKVDYTIFWQAFGILAVIFIWIIWWNRKLSTERNKTHKALEELKESKEKQIMQQEIIHNQAKIADMGKMLANVAHQWRQPLSTISTIATGTKFKQEFGVLNDNELRENMDAINNNAQHLSRTIDTFRNFLKENKDFKEVILQDRINMALDIYSIGLRDKQIEIINNINTYEPIKINLVIGELSQVIGNILNNAKDVLVEKDIKDKWVKLDLELFDNKVIISIEDNGGGIPEDIIPHIFEPYFTTKHQSQGTGLGLNMSYKIVTESLDGNLFVENTKNGAKFSIELPLNNYLKNILKDSLENATK